MKEMLADYWFECMEYHIKPHEAPNNLRSTEVVAFLTDEDRRSFIEVLLLHPRLIQTVGNWLWLKDFLIGASDSEWCFRRLLEADSKQELPFALAAKALLWQTPNKDAVRPEWIEAAWQKSLEFRKLLPTPNEGEGVLAAMKREADEHNRKNDQSAEKDRLKWAAKHEQADKERAEYEEGCFKAHQAGRLAWPGVMRVLAWRDGGSGLVRFEMLKNLTERDDWMREAARRFLVEYPLEPDFQGSGGNAALIAFGACLDDLEQTNSLAEAVMKNWLVEFIHTLCFCHLGDRPEEISKERLCRLFPQDFPKAFGSYVRKQLVSDGSLSELPSFADFWLPAMSEELKTVLCDTAIQPKGFAAAMHALHEHSPSSVHEVIARWLPELPQMSVEGQKAAFVAGALLATNGHCWPDVRQCLNADDQLEKNVWFRLARTLDRDERKISFAAWPDETLLEVANLAWRVCPGRDQRSSSGYEFHKVTTFDEARDLRDHINQEAISRGMTPEIPECTDDDSDEREWRQRTVKRQSHQARAARLSRAWKPLGAAEMLQLADKPHARLARSPDELLQAVVESLRRWETKLKSGDWHRLWDHHTAKSKPEKFVSQEMREWLKTDLDVLAELEVKLADDDRTDILVQVMPQDLQSHPLSLVIEVKKLRKGNRREREVAMKTQLLDRYLRPRQHEGWTHGLYVVAWTPEPGSLEDSEESMSRAASSLCSQAKDLSQGSFILESIVIDARCQVPPTSTRKSAN